MDRNVFKVTHRVHLAEAGLVLLDPPPPLDGLALDGLALPVSAAVVVRQSKSGLLPFALVGTVTTRFSFASLCSFPGGGTKSPR